jgi:hypothetical protein
MPPAVAAQNICVGPSRGEAFGDMLVAMARIALSQPNEAMSRIAPRKNFKKVPHKFLNWARTGLEMLGPQRSARPTNAKFLPNAIISATKNTGRRPRVVRPRRAARVLPRLRRASRKLGDKTNTQRRHWSHERQHLAKRSEEPREML